MQYEKTCKKHGMLSEKNIMVTRSQRLKRGYTLRCRLCSREQGRKWDSEHVEYRIASNIKWRKENRERRNTWVREDRKKNPEKYRRYD